MTLFQTTSRELIGKKSNPRSLPPREHKKGGNSGILALKNNVPIFQLYKVYNMNCNDVCGKLYPTQHGTLNLTLSRSIIFAGMYKLLISSLELIFHFGRKVRFVVVIE